MEKQTKISEVLRQMPVGTFKNFPISDMNNVKGIGTWLKKRGEGEWVTTLNWAAGEILTKRLR